MFGADDAFVPVIYADEFADAISGARKAIIADAAHMAPYEKPAEVFAPARAVRANRRASDPPLIAEPLARSGVVTTGLKFSFPHFDTMPPCVRLNER